MAYFHFCTCEHLDIEHRGGDEHRGPCVLCPCRGFVHAVEIDDDDDEEYAR